MATSLAKAIADGDKREGRSVDRPRTKVKLDRQIVAVAIVNLATEIISDDPDLTAICERWKFKVSSVSDLPIPDHLIPPPLLAGLESGGDVEAKPHTPPAELPAPTSQNQANPDLT